MIAATESGGALTSMAKKRARTAPAADPHSRLSPQEMRWGDLETSTIKDCLTSCHLYLADIKQGLKDVEECGKTSIFMDGFTKLGTATDTLKRFSARLKEAVTELRRVAAISQTKTGDA